LRKEGESTTDTPSNGTAKKTFSTDEKQDSTSEKEGDVLPYHEKKKVPIIS